ncbi:hypothetical protein CANARDRAFT_21799 [[Candida] arabinofermentans NRRL YB-2248]|uniref:Nucleosome assembly protein n=1 Tax=[Candida] arabinofermentans NRRL YB-2248 TaxID=983967 RepID=A0A1E4T510_9ASCO|nr:hypothetical protein CANARDRAFT_21799 [[Candida] arabinofermentans NRRL YB-2248]
MSEPIKKGQIAQAPTPQNTPASVTGSYLSKNVTLPTIPSTIKEDDELHKKLLSNPAILSMIEGKLQTLVGTKSDYVKSLPTNVKERVYGLKALQQLQFKLEAEFQADLLELERKYHAKYAPILSKRREIVVGAIEPTPEEVEEGQTLMEEDDQDDEEDADEEDADKEEESKSEDEESKDITGIPSFWLTCLENLNPVSELINERDADVLTSLTNIKMEYLDTPGFKLIFEFDDNEYFSNNQLVKTYYYQKELGYSGDFIYDHAEGCKINWIDNEHNVTVIVEKRKQRNKHTKQVRTIEKVTPVESFFNFFSPPSPLKKDEDDEDNEEEDDDDEEEDEDLEQKLQLDYEIGELIKDKLIPRAVDWFTGDALNYEFGNEDEYGSILILCSSPL